MASPFANGLAGQVCAQMPWTPVLWRIKHCTHDAGHKKKPRRSGAFRAFVERLESAGNPDTGTEVPATSALFPVRMDIVVARAHRFPMAVHGNIPAAFPMPVT